MWVRKRVCVVCVCVCVCVLPAGVLHAARTSVFGLFNRTNVTAEEVMSNLK